MAYTLTIAEMYVDKNQVLGARRVPHRCFTGLATLTFLYSTNLNALLSESDNHCSKLGHYFNLRTGYLY